MPELLPENREAIEYFMAEGGTFSVATGRALPSFETVRQGLPMNGPTILFNGAAIYDFRKGEYLYTAFLHDTVRPHIMQVLDAWPEAAVELYHDDNAIFALHANELTLRHLHLTHEATTMLDTIDQAPSPISKALFEIMPEKLDALYRYVSTQPWASQYEIVASSALSAGADGQGRLQGRHGAPSGGHAAHQGAGPRLRGRPRQRHRHAAGLRHPLCPGKRHQIGTSGARDPYPPGRP